MTDAFIKISRQEGVKALYSGWVFVSWTNQFELWNFNNHLTNCLCSIWPAVLRQATYGTIKFGTYYTLKKFAAKEGFLHDRNGSERIWCNVLLAVTGKQLAYDLEIASKALYSFYSRCHFKCNRHTNRRTEGPHASTWPWHRPNRIDWMFSSDLSVRRNLRFMASKNCELNFIGVFDFDSLMTRFFFKIATGSGADSATRYAINKQFYLILSHNHAIVQQTLSIRHVLIDMSVWFIFSLLFTAAVIAAVELPVYDFCKLHLLDTFGDHVANHFMWVWAQVSSFRIVNSFVRFLLCSSRSSFIASLGSAIASTPIDVIRVSTII